MLRIPSFALVALLCACQAELPTATQIETGITAQASAEVYHTNEWQTWFQGFTDCGPYAYGNFQIHLVGHTVVLPDGSSRFREETNVSKGRLYDYAGNVYIFQRTGQGFQLSPGDGTYNAEYSTTFRLISKGSAPNTFIDLNIKFKWNGTDFEVISSYLVQCRGKP